MKAIPRLLLALTAIAALSAAAQADTLYGALRDSTAVRTTAGLIGHYPPAGTTDAQRYRSRTPVGLLAEFSHRAPAGTTDQVRQLAAGSTTSPVPPGGVRMVRAQ